MTENRAHLLIFTTMLAVFAAVFLFLRSIHAEGTVYGLAMILVGGAAAYASSLVVMHYDSAESHRRR